MCVCDGAPNILGPLRAKREAPVTEVTGTLMNLLVNVMLRRLVISVGVGGSFINLGGKKLMDMVFLEP